MSARALIQDLVTHRFLGIDGAWVANCRQARVFEHTYLALLEGLEHPEHTQVVWCFQNPSISMYMLVRPGDDHNPCPCETCPLA